MDVEEERNFNLEGSEEEGGPNFREETPESRLEGVQGVNRVGERREEAGEEGVGVAEEGPPRRLSDENG